MVDRAARIFVVCGLAMFVFVACQSTKRFFALPTPSSPTENLVFNTIKNPNRSKIQKTTSYIAQHRTEKEAATYIEKYLGTPALGDMEPLEVMTASELYGRIPGTSPKRLFEMLVKSENVEVRRLAWMVAKNNPSPAMARSISDELSARVKRNPEQSGMSPEAALAVKENKLTAAYPLLRSALMRESFPSYVDAMIAIKTDITSDDFLEFLATFPDEIIAAGSFSKQQKLSCNNILIFFRKQPPSLHHPNIHKLLLFAASADQDLSKATWPLLSVYIKKRDKRLGQLIALISDNIRTQLETSLRNLGDPNLTPENFTEFVSSAKASP